MRQVAQKSGANPKLEGDAIAASTDHPYFHWPLEFPDVFDDGGFDVVLGNPLWDRYCLAEREFFANSKPDIAAASKGSVRKRMITALAASDPGFFAAYRNALHLAEAQPKFAHGSGRFPNSAVGQINLYQLFAELDPALLNSGGRAGLIAPTGLATDNNPKDLFGDYVQSGNIVSFFDFENRNIFETVHSSYKFSLVTLAGRRLPKPAVFAFFLHHTTDLADDDCRFTLSAEDFALINPNTGNCPIFRSRRDAELTRQIYQKVPVFVDEHVLELSYTAWDLQPFAQDLGYDGPPFKWDVERRFETRCELDAAYFRLYEIEREDVDYIMSTFPIVRRKDEAAHGTYRTRDRILEIYEGMASGEWQSSLDPPVADPRAAHPAES